MQHSEERIYYLLKAYTDRTATGIEEKELLEWAASDMDGALLKKHIEFLMQTKREEDLSSVDWNKIYNEIEGKINENDRTMPSRHLKWYHIAAAAAILMAGAGIWLFHKPQPAVNTALAATSVFENDIRPGTSKAVLQAGSTQVILGKNDTSFTMAGNKVNIKGGNVEVAEAKAVRYTLIIPRGGTYSLVLSDGTKVWLNADSKLEYPSVFRGNSREVALTGEAYFDVKTDVTHPFVVKTARQNIRVLGTEFNISAYPDEANTTTTLVKGKVQISTSEKQLILQPGQQAQSDKSGELDLHPDADVAQAIAWKNGYFRFDKANIHTIMTQLARWYNIQVDYTAGLREQYFGAIMNRNNNISQILDMLSATGEVHFKVEGHSVTVEP